MISSTRINYFLIGALATLFLVLGASFVYAQWTLGDLGGDCISGRCNQGVCIGQQCVAPLETSCSTIDECCGADIRTYGGQCPSRWCVGGECCGRARQPCDPELNYDIGYNENCCYPTHYCSGGDSRCHAFQVCEDANCSDTKDTCDGSTFRDYECTGTYACEEVSATTCDSRCNNAPNRPTLVGPAHNIWTNNDPYFQASTIDSENNQFYATFEVSGFGTGTGTTVNSGETSLWGPTNIGPCATFNWRARATDSCGISSNWSGYWTVMVDKGGPSNSISYPTGIINYETFTVQLGENDTCSGIAQGTVQISADDGGSWTFYANTIEDFQYTGANGTCYVFQYRVQDNAGNLSRAGHLTSWTQGGRVCVDVSIPTCSINHPDAWINSTNFDVQLTESDPNGSIVDGDVDIMIKTPTGNWPTIWSDHTNTIDDFTYTGQNCNSYRFRYQVTDDAGNVSAWSDPGLITQIDTGLPTPTISYPSGTINTTTFTVVLNETDDCSGIAQGEVQVSTDDGSSWTAYSNTINNFDYTGTHNECYNFRYRVQDNASNLSNWTTGNQICIDFSIPTCSIDYPSGWINSNNFNVQLIESDVGGSVAGGDVDIMIRTPDIRGWPTIWSDHTNTIDDFTYTGQHCHAYRFRYQVTDDAGNVSAWSEPLLTTQIDSVAPAPNISYSSGTINTTTFTVILDETDDCSGIAQGEVQVSTDGGSWIDHLNTIDNINFVGSYGHSYQFRYRVQDQASNWSNWIAGPTVNTEALPEVAPTAINWSFCPNLELELTWNYSDISNLSQSSFHIQIDNDNDFSSVVLDAQEIIGNETRHILSEDTITSLLNYFSSGSHNIQTPKYYWRIRVKNSAEDWSNWRTDPNLSIFLKALERYSTF